MSKQVGDVSYEIENDVLYRDIVREVESNGLFITQRTPIIDKEAFIKCYEEWIRRINNEN